MRLAVRPIGAGCGRSQIEIYFEAACVIVTLYQGMVLASPIGIAAPWSCGVVSRDDLTGNRIVKPLLVKICNHGPLLTHVAS